jgi:acyl-CoA reductase-like NAD-dependent aldehyde dehydrogenase
VAGFVGSYLQGSGQFCTKPGLLFLPAGHGRSDELAAAVAAAPLGPLLNGRVLAGYGRGLAGLAEVPAVRSLVPPPSDVDGESPSSEHRSEAQARSAARAQDKHSGFATGPALFAVPAAQLLTDPGALIEECFGPAAIVVEYASTDELLAALAAVPGSLTMSVHADPVGEASLARALLDLATRRAGRVVWDAWPTGVAVTAAQHHGGPWPSTTSALHTSVGTAAMRRFLRPVAYQNVPDALLPEPLQAANPLGLPRRVNTSMA